MIQLLHSPWIWLAVSICTPPLISLTGLAMIAQRPSKYEDER